MCDRVDRLEDDVKVYHARTDERLRIKDGKLAFDFIPCIMDGVVGMYEDISGVFYSSQTSTPFIAGPKIK